MRAHADDDGLRTLHAVHMVGDVITDRAAKGDAGGDKRSQASDIQAALQLARNL